MLILLLCPCYTNTTYAKFVNRIQHMLIIIYANEKWREKKYLVPSSWRFNIINWLASLLCLDHFSHSFIKISNGMLAWWNNSSFQIKIFLQFIKLFLTHSIHQLDIYIIIAVNKTRSIGLFKWTLPDQFF
jgi:hypothetical protein